MEEEDHRPAWGRGCGRACCLPIRVVAVLMGFFALICIYTNRVSISHVITKLVIPRNRTVEEKSKHAICPKDQDEKNPGYNDNPIFDWSEQLQGWILGSFYIGYIISHIPGGILSDKYGSKWVLGICVALSGICTAVSPAAIVYGKQWGLIAVRVVMGLAQGPIFPALTTLISAWVPSSERGTLGSACYSGVTFGIVVSNTASGNLLHYYHWSVTLYTLGAMSIAWFIFHSILDSSSPDRHNCIKPKEVAYLRETIQKRDVSHQKIPWKEILISKPMAAQITSQLGHDWGYFVMITCLPKYMNDVLQFSIKSNGYYTSLPFVAMWVSTLICGYLSDKLISKGILSVNTERKLFTLIGAVGPGLFTVLASYCGCNKILVVLSFSFAMFLMGAYYAGQKLTALDMSPSYSGILMALTNGLGAIAGILSPVIVGLLTPQPNLQNWRIVFWLGFAIIVSSALVFWIWGTADIQPYDPKYVEKAKKDDN